MPSFPRHALVALAACHCFALAFGAQIPLGLNLLMRTNTTASPTSTPLGQLFTWDGKPIYVQQETKNISAKMLAPTIEVTKTLDISNQPDFQGLVKSPDGKLYLFSHFEAPRPSALYLTELSQDKATGKLTAVNTKFLNMSSFGGIWTPCAGMVTPWGSYLGGEEYEPDARLLEAATSLGANESTSLYAMDSETTYPYVVEFMRYYNLYGDKLTIDDVKKLLNPYLYGHSVEGMVGTNGSVTLHKWYTMGRNARELAYVMPDNKTVYITDDGTNVGFFKFVMDKPGNLSSGTLYAAKFDQISAEDGGSFEVSWIQLGKANQQELEDKAKTLKFSDMFEHANPAKNGSCPAGFTSINAGDRLEECLKVKPGQEKWAAFFETRRYAATLGATTEFSKWEGLTFSPSRSKIYTSITEVRYGMEDYKKKGENSTAYDLGGPNDIRLSYGKCGCVYELDVDSSYDVTSMSALVCGTTKGSGVDDLNPCSVDSIASPDNVSILDDHDILFIGEDTNYHQNDFVWAYNLETGNMTRIVTTPFGAESTGVYVYSNVNGYTYVMAVAQHPYVESDTAYINNPYSEGRDAYISYFLIKPSDIVGKDIGFVSQPVPRTNATKSQFLGSPALIVA